MGKKQQESASQKAATTLRLAIVLVILAWTIGAINIGDSSDDFNAVVGLMFILAGGFAALVGGVGYGVLLALRIHEGEKASIRSSE